MEKWFSVYVIFLHSLKPWKIKEKVHLGLKIVTVIKNSSYYNCKNETMVCCMPRNSSLCLQACLRSDIVSTILKNSNNIIKVVTIIYTGLFPKSQQYKH